jgi:putative NIF3 family GTP cyclohydrolase 1 type 2
MDNVGLLVEPSEPLFVERVLITNDLTEPSVLEALENKVNMIISYHPPIFVALKRFTQTNWKERSIVKCIENRIAIYSPHTTWDSIEGGINDWILDAFGNTFTKKNKQN